MIDDFDEGRRLMTRAIFLARKGRGRVEPNPMVGCVIARKNRVIGEGWHRRFAGPHAEIEALKACQRSPNGATAYITLEPCCHVGKTPPCTDALIQAGIRRVVVAVRDPQIHTKHHGVTLLRRAGIEPVRRDGRTLFFHPKKALPFVLGVTDRKSTLESSRARLAEEQARGQAMKNAETEGQLLRRDGR